MNSQQQLLLIDSPPNTPICKRQVTSDEDLLSGLSIEESQSKNIHGQSQIKPPQLHLQRLDNMKLWQMHSNFINLNDSADQEECSLASLDDQDFQKNNKILANATKFPYQDLMKKLENALAIIVSKQKIKSFKLYDSVKHIKSSSSYDRSQYKGTQTQRNSRDEVRIRQSQQRKSRISNYSYYRKTVTEPDNPSYLGICSKKSPYNASKVINQVQQKQSYPLRKNNCRKEQFLVSITNWQQKIKIKQKQRMEREQAISMTGVTFTPEINAKSKEMMKKKGRILPIYEREIKTKRIENQLPKNTGKIKK